MNEPLNSQSVALGGADSNQANRDMLRRKLRGICDSANSVAAAAQLVELTDGDHVTLARQLGQVEDKLAVIMTSMKSKPARSSR